LQKDIAMKSLYLLLIIYIGLSLLGCTTSCKPEYTQNAKKTQTALNQPPVSQPNEKNPLTVAVYTEGQKPSNPYKVLGTETVSKFNYGGIKRQIANIHDAMRNLAAKMGGDAVINVAHDERNVTGTVITYQNDQKPKNSA
jgi:hypothetical protein